jgi:glutamyl-Q tRNA(Asp) synthetase
MSPVGRFAPSPTGELHYGSLVAAVASFLNSRSRGGQWLIRVEDIDPPREVAGSADNILRALQRFGMRSDRPVLFQGERREAHRALVDELLASGLAFPCACSRKDLPPSGIYPGTCRNGIPAGKTARAIRLRVDDNPVQFEDLVQGPVAENLEETTGDFVIWRADNLPAYQLAVVADDAFQGVSEVVRGHDLLGSTARQVHVARCLGFPVPVYAHHPVAVTADQKKLSKRLQSDPINSSPRAETLASVLRFLGQECPAGMALDETWEWALQHWDIGLVPRTDARPLPRNGKSPP